MFFRRNEVVDGAEFLFSLPCKKEVILDKKIYGEKQVF
jgi:hypothetical protein